MSEYNIIKPDYNDCVLNIIASFDQYYGFEPKYPTNVDVDNILSSHNFKHIAIMVLDGMGSIILEKNLPNNSFLKAHKLRDMSAVYPSTTTCSINAIYSGLEPLKTGWVGWSNYFDEVGKQLIMFRGTDFFTGEKTDLDIHKILPYELFYKKYPVETCQFNPPFAENGSKTFSGMLNKYIKFTKKNEKTFSYIYWSNPDFIMHVTGAHSNLSKFVLNSMDKRIEKFFDKLPKDTLIIATADHGHIDIEPIFINKYTDVVDLLTRAPSNEGRTTFFSVKPGEEENFKNYFEYHFDEYFDLLTKEEFISSGYLGPNTSDRNPRIDSFIGTYVALAKDKYWFDFEFENKPGEKEKKRCKSHHAGLTENEMITPLIVLKK